MIIKKLKTTAGFIGIKKLNLLVLYNKNNMMSMKIYNLKRFLLEILFASSVFNRLKIVNLRLSF